MVRTLKDVGPYSDYTYIDYLEEDWNIEDAINHGTTRVARWASPSYPPTPPNPFSPGDPWTEVNTETIATWYNKEFRRYFNYVSSPFAPVRGNQQWTTVVWEDRDPNVPYYFIWTNPSKADFVVYKNLMSYIDAQYMMPSGFHTPHCAEYLALDVYFARYSLNFYDFMDNCYSWRIQSFPWIISETIDSEYFSSDHRARVWINAPDWSYQNWDHITNNYDYFAVLPISDDAYLSSIYVSIFGNASLTVDMLDPFSTYIPVFLTEDSSIITYDFRPMNWHFYKSIFSSGGWGIMNNNGYGGDPGMVQRLWLTIQAMPDRYEIRESDALIYANQGLSGDIDRIVVTVRFYSGRVLFQVGFLDSSLNPLEITPRLSFNYYNDRFVWVPNWFSNQRETINWSITTSYSS